MNLADLPWDRAPHLPWRVFTSPIERWAVMPSFVVGEYLFIACAVLALVHAYRQGDDRRRHLLAWAGALLAGTANDVIFMALPLVNNFWQAQATIMITPRLPLYIPCVYVCFMYFPTVSAWRLRLAPLGRAALSGLAGAVFYAPYDIVGAKFLWWTWHDTDPPIANRILGAPIGSTMWVVTFVASFSWLLGRATDRDPKVSRATLAKGLGLVCLSTPLMMLQMTALQQLDRGVPGVRGLVLIALVFAGLALAAAREASPEPPRAADRLLNGAIVVYFATLTTLVAAFDPAAHRSASIHQTYGPCHVEATDITGQKRYRFLCAEDFDEDFSFDCPGSDGVPAQHSEWYTVCGRPHASFGRWLSGVAALGVVGTLLYSYMLGALRRRR
jgi:hypothetical protein